jgi:hypothetical protein
MLREMFLILVISILLLGTAPLFAESDVLDGEYDFIIIPGQGAEMGELLETSEVDVKERLNLAKKIFDKQEKKPMIILSGYGGTLKVREERDVEAEAMFQYINVSKEYLVKEDKSFQTMENAFYSKKLIFNENSNGDVNDVFEEKVLVIVTAKAFYRSNYMFEKIFNDFDDVTIISVNKQSSVDKVREILPMIATELVLNMPTDYLKLKSAKLLFILVDKVRKIL